MESSTVINFTTEHPATVIIVQSTWSDYSIKLDGVEYGVSSATTPEGSTGVRVYTIHNVAAGSHSITRGNGESGILYVEVIDGGTTSIKGYENNGEIISTDFYDLQGRRVSDHAKGVIIRVDRMSNGQKKTSKIVR